jgi:hypothetical protein
MENVSTQENVINYTDENGNPISEQMYYFNIGSVETDNCYVELFGSDELDKVVYDLEQPERKELVKGFERRERWFFKQGYEIDVQMYDDWMEIDGYIYISYTSDFTTDKGIGIGSTKEDVLNTYKGKVNPNETRDGLIIIGRYDCGIIFVMQEDKVYSIYICVNATLTSTLDDFPAKR